MLNANVCTLSHGRRGCQRSRALTLASELVLSATGRRVTESETLFLRRNPTGDSLSEVSGERSELLMMIDHIFVRLNLFQQKMYLMSEKTNLKRQIVEFLFLSQCIKFFF